MLGKLAWADRPAQETGPHTSGAMAWMMWGPQNARYTPPKVLRGLAEALASIMGPWSARGTTAADDIDMYVDAAEYGSTYLVGLWSQEAGARVWECPKAVRNQQAAELQAVERAVKMAAYRRKPQVHLGADNLAAIWAALKRKTKIHHRDRATTVRRIQQTLRWSGIVLKLSYVPSKWNPADAISSFRGHCGGQGVRAGPAHCFICTVLYYGTDIVQKLAGGGGGCPILCQPHATDMDPCQLEVPDDPRKSPPVYCRLRGEGCMGRAVHGLSGDV